MESWAEKTIPLLEEEKDKVRAESDWSPSLEDFENQLQAVLSQKEAELRLKEKLTGTKAHSQSVAKALTAGNLKRALEKKVIGQLKWDHAYTLDNKYVKHLLESASRQNDSGVLIRLARAVKNQPREPQKIVVDRLEGMLVLWWVRCPRNEPGLCRVTDEALTDFCNWAFRGTYLTLEKVRKTRQRLGLEKGAKPWFKKFKVQGDEVTFE